MVTALLAMAPDDPDPVRQPHVVGATAATTEPTPTPTRFPGFRRVVYLGHGSFGTTYREYEGAAGKEQRALKYIRTEPYKTVRITSSKPTTPQCGALTCTSPQELQMTRIQLLRELENHRALHHRRVMAGMPCRHGGNCGKAESWRGNFPRSNIVLFRRAACFGAHLVIVMDFAEGRNLFEDQKERSASGPYDIARARDIFFQLFHAVDHMHGVGICHRDLKARLCALRVWATS